VNVCDWKGWIVCALALSACAPAPRSSARPEAEFLLVSDDSTAWVRTSADTVVVQRAPLLLTTLEQRLVEVYVAEDAMNFDDGSFLVSRVFRRDLASGDSALVFADSTVLREAIRYLRAHPGAERIDEDDEAASSGRAIESSVTPLSIVGPLLSVEVHVDRTVGEHGTHDTYRATVDLASGRRLALSEVTPAPAAPATLASAHQRFAAAVTLAGRREGPIGKAASRALAALTVDSLSFSLTREGDSLAAVFLVHDEQVIDEARDSHRYALEPIALTPPLWWARARTSLPRQLPDSTSRFDVGTLSLDVRYDDAEVATVAARTTAGPRPVTRIRGPLRRVIPIGDSLIKPQGQWRRALARAFSEAGYYSEQVRAASLRRRARPSAARQTSL
jgi:hypothetical protein